SSTAGSAGSRSNATTCACSFGASKSSGRRTSACTRATPGSAHRRVASARPTSPLAPAKSATRPRASWPLPSPACMAATSVMDDGADRLALVHQVEGLVDALQRQGVGDERRELDVAAHRVLDHARQLAAALDPAEGGAQPLAPGHQLERPRADLLARASHADDHALAPAAVRALERRAHHLDVADALEAVVNAPAGHLHDHLLDGPVMVPGVDAVGGTHFGRQPELVGLGVR